jgi:hypothetical protein
MEGVSPSLREQGVQALRDGEIDRAVDLLARVVIADGQDAEAQALLGVAYSQKGLHAQATRALETAIELRPQELRYQFNLGVALEQASDWNGAANAYRRVLQANPEHPQARAKLQALGSKVQSAPVVTAPRGGAVSPSAPPNAPWLAADTLAAGPVATGPPGTIQCAQCKQWSMPGLSCEWCSAPLKPAHHSGFSPSRADTAAPYAGIVHEDRFDLMQACKDWVSVLISPNSFFANQQSREGFKAPLAFLFAYLLVNLIFCLPGFMAGKYPGISPASTPGMAVAMAIGMPIGLAIYLGMLFVWAGIVHGTSKLFGGQGSYAGSFRVVTYALAPLLLLGLLSTIAVMATSPISTPAAGVRPETLRTTEGAGVNVRLARQVYPGTMPRRGPIGLPGRGGDSAHPYGRPASSPMSGANPIALIFVLAAASVYLIYLGMGVYHVHNVSSGAAVGVSIISGIAAIVLEFVIVMLLSVFLVALIAGMRGAMH